MERIELTTDEMLQYIEDNDLQIELIGAMTNNNFGFANILASGKITFDGAGYNFVLDDDFVKHFKGGIGNTIPIEALSPSQEFFLTERPIKAQIVYTNSGQNCCLVFADDYSKPEEEVIADLQKKVNRIFIESCDIGNTRKLHYMFKTAQLMRDDMLR